MEILCRDHEPGDGIVCNGRQISDHMAKQKPKLELTWIGKENRRPDQPCVEKLLRH